MCAKVCWISWVCCALISCWVHSRTRSPLCSGAAGRCLSVSMGKPHWGSCFKPVRFTATKEGCDWINALMILLPVRLNLLGGLWSRGRVGGGRWSRLIDADWWSMCPSKQAEVLLLRRCSDDSPVSFCRLFSHTRLMTNLETVCDSIWYFTVVWKLVKARIAPYMSSANSGGCREPDPGIKALRWTASFDRPSPSLRGDNCNTARSYCFLFSWEGHLNKIKKLKSVLVWYNLVESGSCPADDSMRVKGRVTRERC